MDKKKKSRLPEPKKKLRKKIGLQKEQDISLLGPTSLLGCRRISNSLWLLNHHNVVGHLSAPDRFTFFVVPDNRAITFTNLCFPGDIVHERLV